MPSLRSIFSAPVTSAPPVIDTADLADLTVQQLQQRLAELARQRQQATAQHQARIAPLLAERQRLEVKLGEVDEALATEGILRTDVERMIDRRVQAVQAELHDRAVVAVEDADVDAVDVDHHAVERLLDHMLSGRLDRNMVVASDANMVEACQIYDQIEQEAIAWLRSVVQQRSATGRTPEKPATVAGFNHDVLADIARRQGLLL